MSRLTLARPVGGARRLTGPAAVRWVERLMLVGTLAVGVFLRVFRLDSAPQGLLYDEAFNGVDVLSILGGSHPVFLAGNFGREALFIYAQAASVSLLGRSDLALRAVSSLFGVLTLLLGYALVRSLLGRRVALLATGLLAASLWHVVFSRIGLRAVSLPAFEAAFLLCLWRGLRALPCHPERSEASFTAVPHGAGVASRTARIRRPVPPSPVGKGARGLGSSRHRIFGSGSPASLGTTDLADGPTTVWNRQTRPGDRRRSWLWFGGAGVALGLMQYTYSAARLAPLVVVALGVYLAIFERPSLRAWLGGLLVTLAVAGLVFLPEGLHFLAHPADFTGRASEVSFLNSAVSGGSPARALADGAFRTLGALVARGDAHWDRNLSGAPVFGPVEAALAALGLAVSLRRFRQASYALPLLASAVTLAPAVLAPKEAPNFLRMVGLLPLLYAFPAVGAAWLWERCEARLRPSLRLLPALAVGLGLALATVLTYRDYFGAWAGAPEVAEAFGSDRWAAIQAAIGLAEKSETVLLGSGDHDDPLLRYALEGRSLPGKILSFDASYSLVTLPGSAPTSYVLPSSRRPNLLAGLFPGQSGEQVASANGGRSAVLYRRAADQAIPAPASALDATFGGRVRLSGYDLPRAGEAGGELALTWHWQVLDGRTGDLVVFNHLIDESGKPFGQRDQRAFAPDYWPAGTTGASTFLIRVDDGAPTGPYRVCSGVYERSTLARLPLVDGAGRPAGDQVCVGPVKVRGRTNSAVAPSPAHPLSQTFGNFADLVGFDSTVQRDASGSKLDVVLYWRARAVPPRDYTVFAQLLDSSGRIVSQADSPPRQGQYPTSLWDAGETIVDEHVFALPDGISLTGDSVIVGLYEPETGRRVPVTDGAKQSDFISLGEVRP